MGGLNFSAVTLYNVRVNKNPPSYKQLSQINMAPCSINLREREREREKPHGKAIKLPEKVKIKKKF